MVEAINSKSIIPTGDLAQIQGEANFGSGSFARSLINRNVHVEADQEHALVLERVLRRHVKNQASKEVVMHG